MGEDYTFDDELLIPMLTSPDASLRERGWRIVLWKYGLDQNLPESTNAQFHA